MVRFCDRCGQAGGRQVWYLKLFSNDELFEHACEHFVGEECKSSTVCYQLDTSVDARTLAAGRIWKLLHRRNATTKEVLSVGNLRVVLSKEVNVSGILTSMHFSVNHAAMNPS